MNDKNSYPFFFLEREVGMALLAHLFEMTLYIGIKTVFLNVAGYISNTSILERHKMSHLQRDQCLVSF